MVKSEPSATVKEQPQSLSVCQLGMVSILSYYSFTRYLTLIQRPSWLQTFGRKTHLVNHQNIFLINTKTVVLSVQVSCSIEINGNVLGISPQFMELRSKTNSSCQGTPTAD